MATGHQPSAKPPRSASRLTQDVVRAALICAARGGELPSQEFYDASGDAERFLPEVQAALATLRDQDAITRTPKINEWLARWTQQGWILPHDWSEGRREIAPPRTTPADTVSGPRGADSPLPQCPTQKGRGGKWLWLPPEVVRLPLVLGSNQMAVFLQLMSHVNWSAHGQGGLRAVFATDESIAQSLGRDRANVSRARRGIEARCIFRDPSPEEEAAVLRSMPRPAGPGRRPQIRILVDPRFWRLDGEGTEP